MFHTTYDANGRQISASRTDNTGGESSVYDCIGQRVQTSGNGVTRQMVYDIFGQLVGDYRADNTMTGLERENIYRGGQLLAVYEAAFDCFKSVDSFVDTFFTAVLGTNYTTTEKDNWKQTLRQAQAQGIGPLIGAAQNLGNGLFLDSRYPNPSSNLQYVKDLYAGYLQRDADQDPSGRDFWVGVLNSGTSRANVRLAFAVCSEFSEDMARLCPGTSSSTSSNANLKYVLSDVPGSGRVLMENNGPSSAILARHDYLPFGEEIWAGIGLRSSTQKYATTDKVRQRFALTERDEATGLDHSWFRKYESFAGRWTSPDPYGGSLSAFNPQSFNRYTYVQNDPINLMDPTGLENCNPGDVCYIFPDSDPPITGVFGGTDTGITIELGGEPDSQGQAGGGPQNPPALNPGDVKRDFYKQYGQTLNDCIKKKFGKDAKKVAEQTLQNAPMLDARLNSKQVGALSKTGPAIGNSKPFQGRHGTVFIASETYNSTASYAMDEIYRTFAHELGNVLDIRLNPNVGQARYGRVYGDPKSTIDTDTGEAIEECVFGPRVR